MKTLNSKFVIGLSLVVLFFYIVQINSVIDVILSIFLCSSFYFLIINDYNVSFVKLDFLISVCLSVFFCLRAYIFDYSTYYLFIGYPQLIRYGLLLIMMIVSFPALYKLVSKFGKMFDVYFKEDTLSECAVKLLAGIIAYRLIACTLFEYVLDIEFFRVIDNFVLLYVTVVGFIYTVNRLVKQKNDIVYYSLIVMYVVIILSVFINAFCKDMSCFYDNRYSLFILAFCIFVLYPIGEWIARDDKFKDVASFLRPIYYIWAFGMFLVVLKIFYKVEIPYMGNVWFNRVLWVNEHYNIVSRQIMAFIFIGLYLITYDRKPVLCVLDSVIILLNYILMIMCNSRGALLAGTMCIGFAIYFVVNDKLHNTYISAFSGVITAVLFYMAKDLPFALYETITIRDAVMALPVNNTLNGNDQLIGIYHRYSEGFRDMSGDNGSTLNGRLEIWKYCIEGLFKDPWTFFIGVTRDKTDDFVVTASNGIRWDYHTHNMLLEVICSSGIFAFIPYMIYICKAGIDSLIVFLKKTPVQLKLMAVFVFFIFISYFIEMSFITENALCNYMFFVISGIFFEKIKEVKKEGN